MKKKLGVIKLVSRTPKKQKEVENVDVPVDNYKFTDNHGSKGIIIDINLIFQTSDKNYPNYIFIKDSIRDMFYNIINSRDSDKEKLSLSLEVNCYIKEYKFDKNFHRKLKEDIKPLFYPILNSSSNFLSKYFIKTLPEIIDEVVEESALAFEPYKKYILNELHNIINYRKTSVILLPKSNFDILHDMFIEIKEDFSEQFILGKSKYYIKSSFTLDPFDILDENETYKVVYAIPSIIYGNEEYKLSKNNPRGIMAPVIFNKKGEPESLKLWNSVASINKKYNTNIPVKCLVPLNTFIDKNNKVIKMNNKVLINCFNSLNCFKEKLNRKISLLLFSLTETYYNRKYL